jgi:hypothetical protein
MIRAYIVPVLIVSGAATAGIIALAVAPRQVCYAIFRFELVDWLSNFLARYVGLLVFLIGSLIVYSAFHPEIRRPVLIAAIIEKTFFVACIVSLRPERRTTLALVAAAADALFALIYCAYILALR